jgi:hypothetical protein
MAHRKHVNTKEWRKEEKSEVTVTEGEYEKETD